MINEKAWKAIDLTDAQDCFTTKDTKSTKESETEALDPAFKHLVRNGQVRSVHLSK